MHPHRKGLALPLVFLLCCLCALWPPALFAEHHIAVHEITTRPGVTVRVLLLKPARPLATILLIPGGVGQVSFLPDGSTNYRGFPVRQPELFAQRGFITAVINAPSDRLPAPAMNFFRDSATHIEDVRQVIAFLRKQDGDRPVWLVGHSAGSTSAANSGIKLGNGDVAGIVLISSKNGKYDRASANLDGLNIEEITVPTLVVHHEQDECEYTLFANAQRLMGRLKKTEQSELISFKGGGPVSGDRCGSLHYHGFPGLESEVASGIANWIKANQKK